MIRDGSERPDGDLTETPDGAEDATLSLFAFASASPSSRLDLALRAFFLQSHPNLTRHPPTSTSMLTLHTKNGHIYFRACHHLTHLLTANPTRWSTLFLPIPIGWRIY